MGFAPRASSIVGLLTVALAAGALAPLPTGAADGGPLLADAHAEVTTPLLFSSVDGVRIPVTVYRPSSAHANATVPVLLHSHGWAGSRATSPTAFGLHLASGFGVVSIDMRGHGEARSVPGSVARVHSLDFEIRDVRDVLTYVATLPWVTLDGPGDPRAGALGGSYGGGYQLLTATQDARLDALAPEITWSSLPQSLAPNGAIKSDWVHLLYGGAKATQTRLHEDIDRAYLDAMLTNEFPDGSGPSGVDIVTPFLASSPGTQPDAIRVPTLLVQGVPDTLFNLNEAVANFVAIDDDAPVWLFTHRGGHILSTAGTLPVPSPVPLGLQPGSAGSPCGAVDRLVLGFYNHTLKGDAFALPRITLAFDDLSCRTFGDWPPTGSTPFAWPSPVSLVPSGPLGPKVLLPLRTPGYGDAVLAGIPTVTFTPLALDDATLYFSLVAVGADGPRVLDAQVTPYRFGRTDVIGPVSLALGGVASVVASGETLFLSVETWNEQFATNADRVPEGAALLDLEVGLPIL